MPNILFVKTQKRPAGGKIIVDDIDHLAIDSSLQSRQHNRLYAIIHVRERYGVGATQVQKYPKRIDPYSPGDLLLAGTINRPGSHDDVRNSVPLAILSDDFILSDFGEAIGLPS